MPVHPHVRGEYSPAPCSRSGFYGSSPRAWGIPGLPFGSRIISRFIPTCVGNTACWPRCSDGQAVHPHVRGEYAAARLWSLMLYGSSPRAWGILGLAFFHLFQPRFIPTCVGNTRAKQHCSGRSSVHPHVRGEYDFRGYDMDGNPGSSPRAWGILQVRQGQCLASRFIPTCVGNTTRCRPGRSRRPVHPHVRGEYDGGTTPPAAGGGSSPRAWGIHNFTGGEISPTRFIPTCVGNTSRTATRCVPPPVHPHVRGEYDGGTTPPAAGGGSSPRAWGIHNFTGGEISPTRFIPTCVGNTSVHVREQRRGSVHPHVRGEYGLVATLAELEDGSSPRAWGIPERSLSNVCPRRFIPTCVGNTIRQGKMSAPASVHPHVRGEYRTQGISGSALGGSSPRAWGILYSQVGRKLSQRFIPTCVGNTRDGRSFRADLAVHPHVRGEYKSDFYNIKESAGSSPRAWGIRYVL